jgi:hypothetical protein
MKISKRSMLISQQNAGHKLPRTTTIAAGFLAKNENVNWLEDCFTITVRGVGPQRSHASVKVAATQLRED